MNQKRKARYIARRSVPGSRVVTDRQPVTRVHRLFPKVRLPGGFGQDATTYTQNVDQYTGRQ